MAEGGGARELKTEQAILSRYQDLRNELATLSGRANELAAESQEHDLVLKALEPLDGGRRCYRVVSPAPHMKAVITHAHGWQQQCDFTGAHLGTGGRCACGTDGC